MIRNVMRAFTIQASLRLEIQDEHFDSYLHIKIHNMKHLKKTIPAAIICGLFMLISLATKAQNDPKVYVYKPDSQELHDQIVKLDSIFFYAYNTCDIDKQASMMADSIEFYHDRGGLTTSKAAIMKSIKNNICGKVTRELIKGSIEVYPIKGYGAVQMGLHRFYNKQEPNAISEPGKFITIWKQTGDKWQISRVVSLH